MHQVELGDIILYSWNFYVKHGYKFWMQVIGEPHPVSGNFKCKILKFKKDDESISDPSDTEMLTLALKTSEEHGIVVFNNEHILSVYSWKESLLLSINQLKAI